VAHRDESWTLTWADYERWSSEWAGAIVAAGLAPGEHLAVVAPDGVLVHVAFLAAEKAGVVAVGIGARSGAREIAHLVTRTGCRAVLAGPLEAQAGEVVRELGAGPLDVELRIRGEQLHIVRGRPGGAARGERRLGPDALSIINSTSGTTGMPKCVLHNQNRWWYFHQLAVAAGALHSADVFFSAVPMPFGFGLWTSHFTPTYLGAPVTTMQRFSPTRMIESIAEQRVSVLACVSTQFIMMLNAPELAHHDITSLRVLFTGGEAVPYDRAAEFEERVGAAVLQFYGSNETGALSCTRLDDERDVRLRTAGRVLDTMDVVLVDADGRRVTERPARGRPACRGPVTSLGYWDDDEANRALFTDDGWMLMGDIVDVDDAGILTVVGRVADIIIRGGKNVSAPEVEAEVATHPGVALVAAVPAPDPVVGERVAICVVPRPGWGELTLDDIADHLRSRGVSRDAIPEVLVVVDELPMSSGGKVAKAALRELLNAAPATRPDS
jgi:acyl-CoA synthetase